MSDSDSIRTRRPRRPVAQPHWTARFIQYRFVLFLIILGVMGFLLYPRSSPMPELLPEEVQQQRALIFNGLKIWKGLHEFQTTRGTDTAPYPSDIRQLDEMGITDDIRSLLAVDPKFAGDWAYFWAADSENKDAPLLISPRLAAKDRSPALKQFLLMNVGGSIQMVTPGEAEKAIRSSPTTPIPIPSK